LAEHGQRLGLTRLEKWTLSPLSNIPPMTILRFVIPCAALSNMRRISGKSGIAGSLSECADAIEALAPAVSAKSF
jgi:hypothetical protein